MGARDDLVEAWNDPMGYDEGELLGLCRDALLEAEQQRDDAREDLRKARDQASELGDRLVRARESIARLRAERDELRRERSRRTGVTSTHLSLTQGNAEHLRWRLSVAEMWRAYEAAAARELREALRALVDGLAAYSVAGYRDGCCLCGGRFVWSEAEYEHDEGCPFVLAKRHKTSVDGDKPR